MLPRPLSTALLGLLLAACGAPARAPRPAGRALEHLPGLFLTYELSDAAPRPPGTPVPADDPLSAQFQARMDADRERLALWGRPLPEALATDPQARALWEAARGRPLFSSVSRHPDGRYSVLVQADLRDLVRHAEPPR